MGIKSLICLVLGFCVSVASADVPPLPQHASGSFKLICRNARLRINALPLEISTGQCYNVGYRTEIQMFANGRELSIPDYGAGAWPMQSGQRDRLLNIFLRVDSATNGAGPRTWIMLTDWFCDNNAMWTDIYGYYRFPNSYSNLPAGSVPSPLFFFNQMLGDYASGIVSGSQLTRPLTWGVFGYDEWYRGPTANPRFNVYNHAWFFRTDIHYTEGSDSFDLSSLYGANTKIKTSIANLVMTSTPTVPIQAGYDHLGDLILEIYDDSSPLYRGDFNGSGTCDVEDLFGYLNCYFCQSLAADYDNNLRVDVGDIFEFLSCWFGS